MYWLEAISRKSQQEPRLLAHYANDAAMIDAYVNKKDLYATVASKVYHNDYWDNMEHLEDGTPNPEGKKRRSNCKSIVLGLLYGRGTASVAEQTGTSIQEAQQMIDDFFNGFPTVRDWIARTKAEAYERGYVEDVLGRRRRLPDLNLPKYTFEDKNNSTQDFNPLLGSKLLIHGKENPLIATYRQRLESGMNLKMRDALKQEAKEHGITIHDNTGFISQAERQCVNARVQGGASTITKLAMIDAHNDPVLKDLGFTLMLCIHDELIGECPRENAQAVADRLTELMIGAAARVCKVPMKCDAEITSRWYESDLVDTIAEDYQKMLDSGIDVDTARGKIYKKYSMLQTKSLNLIISGEYECGKYEEI